MIPKPKYIEKYIKTLSDLAPTTISNNISTLNMSKFIRDYNEALNLSVGIFACVGVNNGNPTELGYMVATFEILIGVVIIGIGTGTLVRKVIR